MRWSDMTQEERDRLTMEDADTCSLEELEAADEILSDRTMRYQTAGLIADGRLVFVLGNPIK